MNFDLKLIVIVIICVKGFKLQVENVKQVPTDWQQSTTRAFEERKESSQKY